MLYTHYIIFSTTFVHIESKNASMKKKFRKLLSEKCKDMGLTGKALDDLVEIGAEGLDDDASDEDIAAKVDSLMPYAKAMQGEITRKTRSPKPQSKKTQSNDEGDDEGGNDDEAPEWFKPFQQKLSALESENATLKAEKAKTTRQAEIAAKAKKLGIPDYLMKRVSFADDADLDKELEEYKQELVTNNLMPKEQAHETGSNKQAMEASAKAWAESLPNK